jgi:hypothetical protein
MATGKVTGTGGLIGVEGNSPSGEGVHGESASGTGVKGVTNSGIAVLGTSSGSGEAGHFDGKVKVNGELETTFGVKVAGQLEANSAKVNGNLEATGGVKGSGGAGDIGVLGTSTGGGDGVHGDSSSGAGVKGISATGAGVYGTTNGSGLAGHFVGHVTITGGLTLTGGCAGCASLQSDRNLKDNFSSVNPRFILDRLASIPIQTWNYKSEPASVRHLGAMAQDFRTAFNLGADDKHIDMIDANGVTMAAIQGLYQQNQELTREVRTLKTQVQQLQRTVKDQRKRP